MDCFPDLGIFYLSRAFFIMLCVLCRVYAFQINLILNIFQNSNDMTIVKKSEQRVRKSEVSVFNDNGEKGNIFGMITSC